MSERIELSQKVLTLLIFGPSGSGKTTIIDELLKLGSGFYTRGITMTTREPRTGEVNGIDYHFATVEEFHGYIERGELIEYALVHGNYYGVPKSELTRAAKSGSKVLVLNIDYQGVRRVKATLSDTLTVLVLARSVEELKRRLVGRGTDPPEVIAKRLAGAFTEIAAYHLADSIVMNDELAPAINLTHTIVTAALASRSRHAEQIEEMLRTWQATR